MEKLFGLPAHPLLVHIPVVLGPLAALLALAMVVRPSWRPRLGWLTVILAFGAALGAQLAVSAGEGLEDILGEHSQELESHAERGELARTILLAFFVLVAAWVAYQWWAERQVGPSTVGAQAKGSAKKPVVLALSALMVVSGAAATWAIVDAGHSGAKSAWNDAGKEDGEGTSGDSTSTESGGDEDSGLPAPTTVAP